MACVSSAFTQSAVNGGEKVIKLTDNTDGTYSASFDLNHIGDATISVVQSVTQGITANYYNSGSISGTPDVTRTLSKIQFGFSYLQDVTPGNRDWVAATFTGKLTPFQSGTCDLELFQDDGATLKINGAAQISNYGNTMHGSTNFAYTFNAFETYDLHIDWMEKTDGAHLRFYWDCGAGKVIISSENYAIASDIGRSPLQVSVGCSDKYEQVPSTTDQCRPECGDGFIISPEVCDDNNNNNGDGCNSDCTAVESNWACSGSSLTTKSVCTKCTQGFYQNDPSNPTECIPQCGDGYVAGSETCDDGNTIENDGCSSDCGKIELGWECGQASPTICKKVNKLNALTDQEQAVRASTLSVISISVILNIIGKILNQASRNSILSSINQLQLLILLLLFEIHLPSIVVNYLRSLSSSLIPISIDWGSFPGFRIVWKLFDYPQERDDFEMIDISSGSTIINLNTLVGIFVTFLITHLFVATFLSCNKESQKCCARMARYIKKCLTFEMYFVLVFESFITMCLCSVSEFKSFRVVGTGAERLSFIFAVVFCILALGIIISATFIWIYNDPEDFDIENAFLGGLFSGLKTTKAGRTQILLFFIRRALLCSMIALLSDISRPIFLGLYLGVNCIHCTIICIIRPFEKVADNILEITNELFYVSFCLFLQWHYLKDQWSNTDEIVYYWCLLSNNIINILLPISFFLYTLFTKRYKPKSIKIFTANEETSNKPSHHRGFRLRSVKKHVPAQQIYENIDEIMIYRLKKESDNTGNMPANKPASILSRQSNIAIRPPLNLSDL
ncbi:unnamed protein product [Moneuplotes crassus]|uniref:PA14 domain-containing protein n=1 Tax=Euplotes crassus TaxID=5936 RepID=A0AAD2D0D2_EUPCR|nr:unnamed protein product [Moneuplotes crassus]